MLILYRRDPLEVKCRKVARKKKKKEREGKEKKRKEKKWEMGNG